MKKDLKDVLEEKKATDVKAVFGGLTDDFSGIPVIISEEDTDSYLNFLKTKKADGKKITARAVLKLKSSSKGKSAP